MGQEVQQGNGSNLLSQLRELEGIKTTNKTTDSAVGTANAYYRKLSADEQKYSDRTVAVAEAVKQVLQSAIIKLGEESRLKLDEEAQATLRGVVAKQLTDDLKTMYRNSHEIDSNSARYYASHSNHMILIRDSAKNALAVLSLVETSDEPASDTIQKLESAREILRETVKELDEAIPVQSKIDDEEWTTLQFERAW